MRTRAGWFTGIAIAVVLVATGVIVGAARPAAADAWSDKYCTGGSSAPTYWKRSNAIAYA